MSLLRVQVIGFSEFQGYVVWVIILIVLEYARVFHFLLVFLVSLRAKLLELVLKLFVLVTLYALSRAANTSERRLLILSGVALVLVTEAAHLILGRKRSVHFVCSHCMLLNKTIEVFNLGDSPVCL